MSMLSTSGLHSQNTSIRLGYVFMGWICVGLGVIGAALPVMPTTCFMIAALACFTKGSPRLAEKLLSHRRFGPSLQAWQTHRAIPTQVKVVAISSMALTIGIIVSSSSTWMTPLCVGGLLAAVAAYIVTRPVPPGESKEPVSCTSSKRIRTQQGKARRGVYIGV